MASDLVDDRLGRGGVGALTGGIATQVVDDHLGAVLGQHQGVFPADATTGTGHDGHAACTDVAHLMFSWMWMRGGRGPLRG